MTTDDYSIHDDDEVTTVYMLQPFPSMRKARATPGCGGSCAGWSGPTTELDRQFWQLYASEEAMVKKEEDRRAKIEWAKWEAEQEQPIGGDTPGDAYYFWHDPKESDELNWVSV